MFVLLITTFACSVTAATLTVGDTQNQKIRYGLDYERLWYWYGSGLGNVPEWSVNDCDIDFIRTAMNSKYELTEGVYDLSAYTQKIIPMMTAMQNANADIKWFASPRPLNEAVSGASWQPYPLWVTGASSYTAGDYDFNATKCAEYMIRYLLLMKSYGFKISYMDLTNEWQSNFASGGRFAPDDAVTIKQIFEDYLANPWPHPALDPNLLLEADDFPLMVGSSAWNYDQGGQWISKFTTAERQNAIDIAASHNTDPTGSAQAFADSARAALGDDAEIWNSEVHDWKSTSGYNEVTSFSYMTDAIRAGFTGLSGWLAIGTTNQGHSYFLNNGSTVTRNVKYYIFKKLSNSSNYGHAYDINLPTEFASTAALIKDDLLTVWVINTSANSVSTEVNIGSHVMNGSTINYTQWNESLTVEGVTGSVVADTANTFTVSIAAESVYCFEVALKDESLLARWEFNDGSGAIATDSTGSGFDGTVANANWVSGVDGTALAFNGSNTQVSVPGAAFNSISDQITISLWAYGDSSMPTDNSAFYAVNSSGGRILNVHLPWNNSTVYWDAGDSGYDRINKVATAAEFKDSWAHWVFTKNASTGDMNIYRNGELWHSGTGMTKTMTSIASATIGSQTSNLYYTGNIDEVLLYNRELNAAEVASLFAEYSPPLPPVFESDPINTSNASEDVGYSDSLVSLATDPNGDALSFTKTSGPAWLTVDSSGTLSGTPSPSDIGLNTWTVEVSDGSSGSDTTTLNITVDSIANKDAFVTLEAEDYDEQSGVATEACSEGGLNIASIRNGARVGYINVDFGSGSNEFVARVASATSGGNIEIRLDSPSGTLLGTSAVSGTGGWQTWTTVSTSISNVSGVHNVYLVFTGSSGYLMNLNWFTFTETSYSLTYSAGANGSLSGASSQTVSSGDDGSAVTAVADVGYQFVNWSDSSTANPRTDINVTSDLSVTANFQVVPNKDAFATIEGEIYDDQFGVSTQTSSEGGLNVQAIQNGDWVAYYNVDFGSGANAFEARVASDTAGGNIEIRLDSPSGTLLGTCAVSGTNGWQTWTTVSTSIADVSGVQNVYLVFTGGSGYLMNLNWISFANMVSTHTLSYSAGAGGSISGTSPQVVSAGGNGSAVTAVADTGYSFVDWSDGSTANPRTDLNVLGDVAVTANFAINSYTLTYTAGSNGSITGSSPQSVNHGSNGSSVTAVADTGYSFVDWSDGSTANPRTDSNVTGNVSVSANFEINTYSLSYTAGTNGSITGSGSQTVDHGTSGSSVSAVADAGYHFVSWSDSSTENPRTDLNVTGDLSVTASFAINTYTLNYTADANGSITGSSSQTVDHGDSGSAVTAVPVVEFYFVDWSDGSTDNPRTDLNVSSDIGVTANFATPVAYNGPHSIPGLIEAEDYDDGIEGYGYHDTTAGNTGGAYRSDDVDIQVTGDTSGSFNVGWTKSGEWLEYLVENVIPGEYLITLRAANNGSASDVRITVDGVEIDVLSVPNTGGIQTYSDVTAGYSVVLSTTDPVVLGLEFIDGNINVNWIDITAAPVNNPPLFTSDPISTSNATEAASYSATIAGSATDADGDSLTYSKVSGPAWLSVASDGALSGTPSSSDVGANSFTVAVSDGAISDTATLDITVDAAASNWTQLHYNSFDTGSGWDIWNDPGSDARRNANDVAYAIGTHCIRLRDDSDTSFITTDNLALSGYTEVEVDFTYICASMDNADEDFWLQISTDGGVTFTTVEEWNESDEFVNDVREYDTVVISGYSLNDQTQLRFRCDASGNTDYVYIDDVVISAR